MIIAKGFEFVKKSRYSRCEKCPFQQEVPAFRALRAVGVRRGVGAGEAQVWLLWEGGSPSPVPLALITTSPGGVRPESSRAPHDLPLILQRVRQVRTEDGQDPGPRRLVPSRTSLELAAPVGFDYNPTATAAVQDVEEALSSQEETLAWQGGPNQTSPQTGALVRN